MIELRPYQQQVIDSVMSGWSEFTRQLAVAPTGSGKTVIFSHLAQLIQPRRTLILAHREELIDQAVDKLHKATGIFAQKEKAEFSASHHAPVVVASIQTMSRRLDKWPADHFGLVVCDEAHHAISNSWQRVLKHFDSSAWILGVTATPDRGDKKNLGKYFENIAVEISLFDLVNQGYLSRIRVQSIPLQIDLTRVRQTAGDYNETDLGNALAPYMRSIAQSVADVAAWRRTLVFLPLIATSKAFAAAFCEAGLTAEHIDGISPDRREILDRFARGKCDVLCNAMLLTEGFDDPGIDCVIVLRPTRSRPLYAQMVGRGTRVAPFKQDLLLLDFLWLHESHSLIRPAHLVAQSEEIAIEMTKIAEAGGAKQEILDLEGLASEVQVQREKKLQEELAAKAKRKARTIDALEFCLSLHEVGVAEYEPSTEWDSKPPTSGQIATLERNGFDMSSIKNRGHASKMMDLIVTRCRMNLATPKQMRLLRQLGHPRPETAGYGEASAYIDKRLNRNKKTAATTK